MNVFIIKFKQCRFSGIEYTDEAGEKEIIFKIGINVIDGHIGFW
jgi:hypothetical protein